MLLHGTKQVIKAFHGSKRVRALYHGGKKIFTGGRLSSATLTALNAAFGVKDGQQVFFAATDYLNNMALANYINEDPMLVCSLGLQPKGMEDRMPIRWLVGDGKAYINLGNLSYNPTTAEVQYTVPTTSGSYSIVSARNGNNRYYIVWIEGNIVIGYGTSYTYADSIATNKMYTQKFISTNTLQEMYLDGKLIWSGSPANDSNTDMCVFARKQGNSIDRQAPAGSKIGYANFYDKGWYVPWTQDGSNGMLDLIGGTFYPNANTTGSFSISYTLPDGTPWTPANQA